MASSKKTHAGEKVRVVPAARLRSRVTLRDIAQAVGVTPVSVSLALRNSNRVSEPMRRKIHKQAETMGYRPDPMLAALSHYRRGSVKSPISAELAWINCWPDPKKLRAHKEFNLCWNGAFAEAEQCGYRLEEFHLDKTLSAARLEQILQTRNIQGILLPPLAPGAIQPLGPDFHWEKFCAVRFGYSVQNPRIHIVTSDQLANGMLACENIRRLGYKRIGLVTGQLSTVRFAAGYLHHQMHHDSLAELPPLKLREHNREDDRRALAAWIKKNKPDAIFTDCGRLREMLEELNIRVPRDIGLAATSTVDGNIDAGIYQNSEEIGRAAVQQVISLIHHNDFGIPKLCRELLVEGCWVDGSALPAKR